MAFHARLYLGCSSEGKALLKQLKTRLAALVHSHHLALNDGRMIKTVFQGGDDVGKLKVLWRLIAAQNRKLLPVEVAQNAQPIELWLKYPIGIVKQLINQGAEHRLGRRRHLARRKISWRSEERQVPRLPAA